MKGGNEVSAANGITLCSKGEIPYFVADNLPWMAPVSGANLTAKAVKEKRKPPKSLNVESPSVPLVRGRLRPLY